MLFPKCPTCGKLLADIVLEYEEKMKQICNNPQLTNEQKDKAKTDIINSFNLTKYCCRMRLISYVDLPELLV